MSDWFRKQWHLIEGNVKFYILLAVLGLTVPGVTGLTHGLSLRQQLYLSGIFAVVLIWAVIATWVHVRVADKTMSQSGTAVRNEDRGLRERLFSLSKNIKEFLKSYGEEPDWDFTAVDRSEGGAKFTSDNQVRIIRCERIKHGFYFRFHNDVLSILHECGEKGIFDEELFKALGGEFVEDSEVINIADKLALLAARVEG